MSHLSATDTCSHQPEPSRKLDTLERMRWYTEEPPDSISVGQISWSSFTQSGKRTAKMQTKSQSIAWR